MSSLQKLLKRFSNDCPQALLFDLDGTLVDSVPDLAVAVDATLVAIQLPPAGELRVRQWVGNGAVKLIARALADANNVTEQAVCQQQLDQAHQLFLGHYAECNGRYSRLYAGVKPMLAAWQRRHIPLAIVTNKPIQFVPQLLAQLSIADYFSLLVGGECVAEKKPSPLPLLFAAEQLRVNPQQCLMVGDSRNDVLAAQAALMPVVALRDGYNHGEPIALVSPDLIVDSCNELLPTL